MCGLLRSPSLFLQRSTALLKSIFSHLRVVPLHSFTLLDSKPPPNDRGKVPTSKTDHTVKAEMRETVNTYTLPPRLAVRDERRCSEIVLTPSTILERLEIIFPPKRAAEEVKVARAVHNADDISKRGPIPLGTRDSARSHAFITVGRLRACCQPIPWERVQLQRVSTSIQAECGEKKVSDFNSRITGGSNGVPKIFVTPAVYNIFIPPRFLLPDSQMTRRCQTGMARAVMEDGGFLREFGGFRCSDKGWPHRGGIIASRNKSNSTKRHSEKEKKMSNHPVWLQHVAVLHHIPGLTDPGTETLNLKDFASHIRRQQRNGELSCPHCLSHQNSAADTPFRTHKGGDNFSSGADEAEREPRFASSDSVGVGVGVWIIRPCCESTFFALRFNTGTDHHEWLCKPHTTLWPQTEEGTIGHRTSVAAAARDAVAPLLWARQSLCRTLRANFFPQSQAKGALMGSLSTILYYYASGTALTASEKLVVAEQLLETTNMQPQQGSRDHPHTNHLRFLSCRASQRKESRNSKQLQNSGEVQSSDGVLKLAEVWAPLPRSSFLLRGRRVTESPQALAEAMKYGLLRVFW